MRILVVHPRLTIMGGGERVAIHSITEALREGHEVYLATEKFDVDAFEDFFGVTGLFENVRILTYRPFRPILHRAVLYQRLMYNQVHLQKIVSHNPRFDLLLNTSEVANQPATKSTSVQYCYFPEYFSHMDSAGSHSLWNLYYLPARAFYHSRVNKIDRLLAVSNFTRDIVKKIWGRESTTLYPPCPIGLYNSFNVPKEDLVVTVGRIAPEKRLEYFLEIARESPSAKFVVIGSVASERSSYFNRLKANAPNNLSFMISPLRKVGEILARAKVYLHCARNEHFGITIVEAMAAGCVPIVHDSGGPREIVTDEVGYKWSSKNQASEYISLLTKDDKLRRRLSTAATFRAQQFGPEKFESGIGRMLRSLGETKRTYSSS